MCNMPCVRGRPSSQYHHGVRPTRARALHLLLFGLCSVLRRRHCVAKIYRPSVFDVVWSLLLLLLLRQSGFMSQWVNQGEAHRHGNLLLFVGKSRGRFQHGFCRNLPYTTSRSRSVKRRRGSSINIRSSPCCPRSVPKQYSRRGVILSCPLLSVS